MSIGRMAAEALRGLLADMEAGSGGAYGWQSAAAKRLGLHESQITRVRAGRTVSVKTARALAVAALAFDTDAERVATWRLVAASSWPRGIPHRVAALAVIDAKLAGDDARALDLGIALAREVLR